MLGGRHVPATVLDGQFHDEGHVIGHGGDDEVLVEDLDLPVGDDARAGDDSTGVLLDAQGPRVGAVILDHQRLDVEHHVGHVLDDSGNRREFVLHALNLNARHGAAFETRQQNPPQAVSDRHSEPALKGFRHEPAVRRSGGVDIGNQPAGQFESAPTYSHRYVSLSTKDSVNKSTCRQKTTRHQKKCPNRYFDKSSMISAG